MISRVLTIAGSDSGGGAGIQADLKTCTVLGTYGMTAVTAVTAQNTRGVSAVQALPASIVRQQIDAVVTDIGCDAVKTGMLANAEIIEVVAAAIRQHHLAPVVVDPVLVAESGASLFHGDAVTLFLRTLVPQATLITPNVHEAERLTGSRITSLAEMRRAARALCQHGAHACLVKGGHFTDADSDEAIDVFDDGTTAYLLRSPRLATPHTHGTGCQLSAATASFLAQGHGVLDAVYRAKQFITVAIQHGCALGQGHGPANPLAWHLQTAPAVTMSKCEG